MDRYKELAELIKGVGGKASMTIMQGIVKRVNGVLCDVEIGAMEIPDVRLRASQTDDNAQLLITPAIGSAVIVGSLSGDLTQLVVLAVDKADSILINGGKLGGLINIEQLTSKLNDMVQAFNSHTHQGVHGPTSPPLKMAQPFQSSDYEDKKVKH